MNSCQLLVTVRARPSLDRLSTLVSNRSIISSLFPGETLPCSFPPLLLSESCKKQQGELIPSWQTVFVYFSCKDELARCCSDLFAKFLKNMSLKVFKTQFMPWLKISSYFVLLIFFFFNMKAADQKLTDRHLAHVKKKKMYALLYALRLEEDSRAH